MQLANGNYQYEDSYFIVADPFFYIAFSVLVLKRCYNFCSA
jgi:hypothetical protein